MSHVTLPGTIPGLLRPCSPVIIDDGVPGPLLGVVRRLDDHDNTAEVAWKLVSWWPLGHLYLDLEDPTGRVHAAWWVRRWMSDRECRGEPLGPQIMGRDLSRARHLVQYGMEGRGSPGLMRGLVLRLAGREA